LRLINHNSLDAGHCNVFSLVMNALCVSVAASEQYPQFSDASD